MTFYRVLRRIAGVTALAVALLTAAQPLGVLRHLLDDHLASHAHALGDDVAIHGADGAGSHHDADHDHVWMPPAAPVFAPGLGGPQMIAAVPRSKGVAAPSAALLPPFSPPRA